MAKILVVEDDPGYSNIVEAWLADENHVVEVSNDGLEAREKMQKNKYDVIVLDWDLPGVRGIDLCKEFRSSGGATPILMLTGKTAIEEREEGLDAGADDYLTKPFHLKELSARLRALLRRPAPADTQGSSSGGRKAVESNYDPEARERMIGTVLAERYEIQSFIGEGGESIVYAGRHTLIDKPVAIKFLRPRFRHDERRVQRFQKEGRASSRLNHPNIITVFDYGLVADDQPYIVMEFVKGISLAQILDKETALPVKRFVNLFVQVCEGLEHAHEDGLIHRDLKPSNIMIVEGKDRKELAKIVDFGMVMILPSGGEEVQRLTQAGEFVGTTYYMSPEQCRGKVLDARSDVYSLGCVMYESLSGLPPFMGQDVLETMQMHLSDQPAPFEKVRADLDIPSQLEAIVFKAMEKSPERRHASVAELKLEILKCATL